MTIAEPRPPRLDEDDALHARRWKILGVLCLSLIIVMVGNMSLNVALPALARELRAGTSDLQWIVDAYALVFAGLLFPAGAVGDRFGRKKVLQAGLTVFLIGAVMASLAESSTALIIARAVMGAAAAFVMPSTLSILTNVFPPEERAKAISTWAGVAAGGAAIGPVTSGLVIEAWGWSAVFLVNVPVIVIALIVGYFLVPESRNPEGHPLDAPGAALAMVAVASLVYAIIQGPEHGWTSSSTLGTFVLSAVTLALFCWRESTAEHPMLHLSLFRDRRFSVASAGIGLAFFAMFGTWFLMAQYLQLVLGYSAVRAGMVALPFSFIMLLVAPRAPKLVVRFGNRSVATVGLVSIAIGLAAFVLTQVDSSGLLIYAALIPMAFGMALTTSPLTTMIMSSVSVARAGVGSAMNDTTRELGGALGVAVLGSIVSTKFGSALVPAVSSLPAEARDLASSGLSGSARVAEAAPGPVADALRAAASSAFVEGLHTASLAAAGVVLVAAAASWFLIPAGVIMPGAPAPSAPAAEGDDRGAEERGPGDQAVEAEQPDPEPTTPKA